MPEHPIYVDLLPAAAQQVIGQVHPDSKPALKNLQAEGFTFSGMVDIFDAGACISCARDEIRTIKECAAAVIAETSDGAIDSPTFMIARAEGEFRACLGPLGKVSNGARISSECARVLGIGAGERISFSPLRPAAGPGGAA